MVTRFISRHKKLFLMFLFGFVMAAFTFAADTKAMDDRIYKIVSFFNGGWVKGICCILLIGECLGLLFAGGQNPQIFKKFLPFIVGTVLFMCAGKIVNIIWGSDTTNFETDLKSTTQGYVLPIDNNPGYSSGLV